MNWRLLLCQAGTGPQSLTQLANLIVVNRKVALSVPADAFAPRLLTQLNLAFRTIVGAENNQQSLIGCRTGNDVENWFVWHGVWRENGNEIQSQLPVL